MTHGGGWLTVTDVVSQANELLRATYQLYYHPGSIDNILRTVSRRHSGEVTVQNEALGESVNMLSRRHQGTSNRRNCVRCTRLLPSRHGET